MHITHTYLLPAFPPMNWNSNLIGELIHFRWAFVGEETKGETWRGGSSRHLWNREIHIWIWWCGGLMLRQTQTGFLIHVLPNFQVQHKKIRIAFSSVRTLLYAETSIIQTGCWLKIFNIIPYVFIKRNQCSAVASFRFSLASLSMK